MVRKIKGNQSSLDQHTKKGKQLIAPMNNIQNMKMVSWGNDRLPKYLWVALILTQMDRQAAISKIKYILKTMSEFPKEIIPNDISIISISKMPDDKLENFVLELSSRFGLKKILTPILMFDSLPKKNIWQKYIEPINDKERNQEIIENAILKTYFHQSQEATDCRWARYLYKVLIGKMKFPDIEYEKAILDYPNFGDMREIRPFIRASEINFDLHESFENSDETDKKYVDLFWKENFEKSDCKIDNYQLIGIARNEELIGKVKKIIDELILHYENNIINTDIDEKLDSVFGISIFSLRIFEEMIEAGLSYSILGRHTLRTITECYITLKYLETENNDDKWKLYRNYGNGQAKLNYLRMEEKELNPNYIKKEVLSNIADEDMWKEFVNMNFGNWDGANLRLMSQKSGTEEEYNKYYGWTSGLIHGH